MPARWTITDASSFIEPSWDAPANVRAVTTTRVGGFSTAPFAGFNLANHVGDEPDAVSRNRDLLNGALALPAPPVWLDQTHGSDIVQLVPGKATAPIAADGSIAAAPGVVCAVMTADCLPLFLCNTKGTRVAAVHVGWRGLAAGIIEAAVTAFDDSPQELLAWAGPCISIAHFEIGEEVKQQLGGLAGAYRTGTQSGKYYADLPQLAAHRLADAGVNEITYSGSCTFADEGRFFSHRRDQQTGRMASLIWIES